MASWSLAETFLWNVKENQSTKEFNQQNRVQGERIATTPSDNDFK